MRRKPDRTIARGVTVPGTMFARMSAEESLPSRNETDAMTAASNDRADVPTSDTAGRELVILDRRDRSERRQTIDRRADRRASVTAELATRPDSSFVAHLIATSSHAPQTRTLRREDAGVATATYLGTTRPAPTRAQGSATTCVV